MGWLVALVVVVLLAILPLGVSAKYDADGILVRIIAGPLKIKLFPADKKADKKKEKNSGNPEKTGKPQATAEPQNTEAPQMLAEPQRTAAPPKQAEPKKAAGQKKPSAEKTKQKGGSILDFLPLVQVALDFLNDFRRKLRVDLLELKIILGGGDPCDLAVNYGKAWAAVGNLLPQLERVLVIKKRDVEVECDFMASATTVIARLDLTITLGRLLSLAVRYAVRGMFEFIKINNKRKGGTVK